MATRKFCHLAKLLQVFADIDKSTFGAAFSRFQVIICVCRKWKKLSSQGTRRKLPEDATISSGN